MSVRLRLRFGRYGRNVQDYAYKQGYPQGLQSFVAIFVTARRVGAGAPFFALCVKQCGPPPRIGGGELATPHSRSKVAPRDDQTQSPLERAQRPFFAAQGRRLRRALRARDLGRGSGRMQLARAEAGDRDDPPRRRLGAALSAALAAGDAADPGDPPAQADRHPPHGRRRGVRLYHRPSSPSISSTSISLLRISRQRSRCAFTSPSASSPGSASPRSPRHRPTR